MSTVHDALKKLQQKRLESRPKIEFEGGEIHAQVNYKGRNPVLWISIGGVCLLISGMAITVASLAPKLQMTGKTSVQVDSVRQPTIAPESTSHTGTREEASQKVGIQNIAESIEAEPKQSAALQGETPSVVGAKEVPTLKLQGIATTGDRAAALINGKVVMVGDRVSGYTVQRIMRRSVILVSNRDEITLTLE